MDGLLARKIHNIDLHSSAGIEFSYCQIPAETPTDMEMLSGIFA